MLLRNLLGTVQANTSWLGAFTSCAVLLSVPSFCLCACSQMEDVDWDKGLPSDVLALVAKAGGVNIMKSMRGACKTWQHGFELAVTGIKVHPEDPVLRLGDGAAHRFPRLTILDVGESQAHVGDLQGIQGFSNLRKLVLGNATGYSPPVDLSSRVTNESMIYLRGLSLRDLSLRGCCNVTDAGMESLRGMSLVALSLSGCSQLTPGALDSLAGMPLAKLDLLRCFGVLTNHKGLEGLRGLPLTNLSLGIPGAGPQISAVRASLAPLLDLPLTSLSLFGWRCLENTGLRTLAKIPLSVLSLCGCDALTDGGLALLRGLPLTCLDLSGCPNISDRGMLELEDMDLTVLGLGRCIGLTVSSLKVFVGMPLHTLCLSGWAQLTNENMFNLLTLPLTSLYLNCCPKIRDRGIVTLLEVLPLTHINVDFCMLSGACLERLSGIINAEIWWHYFENQVMGF